MTSRTQFEQGTGQTGTDSFAWRIFSATYGDAKANEVLRRGGTWGVKAVSTDTLGQTVYQVSIGMPQGPTTSTNMVWANGSVTAPTYTRDTSQTELPSPDDVFGGERVRNPNNIAPVEVSRPGESVLVRQSNPDRLREKMLLWINDMSTEGGKNQPILMDRQDLANKYAQWLEDADTIEELLNMESRIVKEISGLDIAFGGEGGGLQPIGTGGGGGSGGGRLAPQYRAPDRRTVEDFVKGSMITLIGSIPSDQEVNRLTNLYMRDYRRNFDSLDAEIDPAQSVKQAIRQTEQYKTIHANRPESVDESTWISDRRVAGARGGLNVEDQEEFAIKQASVAGDVDDAVEAGGVQQTARSGSTRGTVLESRVKGAAQALFQGVRV